MTSETNLLSAKALIDRALRNSGNEKRYLRRLESNPILAKLGCLPKTVDEISNEKSPWFCHGLAFRMAAYSEGRDYLFERWETLLKLAQKAKGWKAEYVHWNKPKDHWAKKWDRFHQFLWLLQCFEYFVELGYDVSFPAVKNAPKPDLHIVRKGERERFVECFFYSKWWHREFFVEELLRFLEPNLAIKRTHNVRFDLSNNPMSVECDDRFVDALAILEERLTPSRLDELRAAANEASPQLACEFGEFSIMLEGTGEYQPSQNAHGDPADSWLVFAKEIIKAKRDSNGLNDHRPNVVMVNGLGLDFQLSFDKVPLAEELPCSLDEIWIYKCGISDKVEACQRFRPSGKGQTAS